MKRVDLSRALCLNHGRVLVPAGAETYCGGVSIQASVLEHSAGTVSAPREWDRAGGQHI